MTREKLGAAGPPSCWHALVLLSDWVTFGGKENSHLSF